MKQPVPFALRVLLSIVVTSFCLQAWGLDCAPADIILTNQTEVDALSATECNRVTGKFFIRGSSITSLESLSNLTSVGGDLSILNLNALINLVGLTNISSVGGGVFIRENAALTNLLGLTNLASVGGDLRIDFNTSLTNLAGLANLTSLGEDLNIEGNASLTNLDGLANLTNVGGYLAINDNTSLNNLNGLANLASVARFLRIEGNASLTTLDGLLGLISLSGGLNIRNNAMLTNVDGLSSLESVGEGLWIISNHELAKCSSLSRLLDRWDDAEPGPGPDVGGFPDIEGEVNIGYNLGGCNSVEEILATVNPSQLNSGLNDAWYYPETSGQGFFITVFPDLGYVSLAWFTYDTELPPMDATANLGDPGHRWLTAVGPIEGNQVLMDIEMTSGGIFDSATEIIRTDPSGSDGTILLTFTSCWSGTVEYDIPSINRQGIVPIQRVTDDNIALCEALNSN